MEKIGKQRMLIYLAIMLCIFSFEWVDRFSISILIDPIEKDLNITDHHVGLINGALFSLVYSLSGFLFSYLVNKVPSGRLLAVVSLGAGLFTLMGGIASGLWSFAFSRLAVAFFEGGSSPVCYYIISRYFPDRYRARAISVYNSGISLGIWIGLSAGGMLVPWLGWRYALFILGAPGLVLALGAWFIIRETSPALVDIQVPQTSFAEGLQLLVIRKSYWMTGMAYTLLVMASSGFESWCPAYLIRSRELTVEQAGNISGLVEGIGGISGTIMAGVLCDYFVKKDRRAYGLIPLVACVLVNVSMLAFFQTTGAVSYLFYAFVIFGIGAYLSPVLSLSQEVLPPAQRALGATVILVSMSVIGAGGGNYLVGVMSDLYKGMGMRDPLQAAFLSMLVAILPAGVLLILSCKHIKQDMDEAQRLNPTLG
ncbi:MFS transporter [Acetobacter sp.]|jgi:predicted MFS family arabinose efflux permease|uniref:MFS transporter n=1 Tax=Acetobacter sp. TaxID=440 RepID=UPI0025BA2163|nr:MFS transporter [Acetobacter sp.]MCH4092329.1 MFS transporter [Acetobacter sp.]MCI1300995.1 MFS transporter [Acetobacter sp.]MCI1317233.1 MFS transporter [Acetobacter sp.]